MTAWIIFLLSAFGLAVFSFYAVQKSIVRVGDDEVGLVFKKVDLRTLARRRPAYRMVAVNGEAGWQANTLGPGVYPWFWHWMYEVTKVPVITIGPGEIGLVIANDGESLPAERQLGRVVECQGFQDGHAFLTQGGQKGRQLGILKTGAHRINSKLFTVITAENATAYGLQASNLRICTIGTGRVGIVTTLDGVQMPHDNIAGSIVEGHTSFQDGQEFIDAGGCKGLQEEVLQAGAYHLNPWFVQVEQVPMTHIPPGTVGVVISHVGKTVANHTGDALVEPGYKGVWRTPLPPGQHPLNPKVLDVEIVPTYEITLDWSNKEKPSWNYDAPLRAVSLRSNDGHVFDIEVTQVISIRGEDAPKMILRVGSLAARELEQSSGAVSSHGRYRSIRNLVTRVLEPMIGNYFRNSAQDYGVLDFLERRGERQRDAVYRIKEALSAYGVQAIGTFINEIDLPDAIEKTLQDRKFAEEEQKTLAVQQVTEVERQRLAEQRALTARQAQLVEAQTKADIAPLLAEVQHHDSLARAEATQLHAEATANATRLQAAADADAMRTKAEANAVVQRIKDEAEAAALREREQIRIKVLRELVEVLGLEGYIRSVQLEQLPNLQLPGTVFGSAGLLDTILAKFIDGEGSRPAQLTHSETSGLVNQVIQFLKAHPTELQVVLKSLGPTFESISVMEVEASERPVLDHQAAEKAVGDA